MKNTFEMDIRIACTESILPQSGGSVRLRRQIFPINSAMKTSIDSHSIGIGNILRIFSILCAHIYIRRLHSFFHTTRFIAAIQCDCETSINHDHTNYHPKSSRTCMFLILNYHLIEI